MASATKHHCLIVLPSSPEGVSAQSFIQCFTLTHSAFSVAIATPQGKSPEFINQDDQSRRWLNDFRSKPFAIPLSLDIIDVNRYSSIVLPHAPGAAADLAEDKDLGLLLCQFVRHKKLVCAIGMGVAGLFSAKKEEDKKWAFKSYALTGLSVLELCRVPNFATLKIIPEDVARDLGGHYSASGELDAVHVSVDRNLVTGQNEASTLTAVQNLVLLANQNQR
ncbi:glutamine amidotransferase-like class 1 domain-containing protein 1 [Neocloeon triangulifer]|uniref:glutamine amidotransferase-like class 1 domain-containing protein 1 n=1 Tax=Neocloeon triangulifer TaxID=2078957 RepID=UPI00286F46CA|nr:glutamine amidotransferase-like class 1 domain-containing protein 1 [Neocloeon triangulifer]